ncbi:MAG TPA: DegV family protein [Candidatus Atopostipes pullistercoris]|uniref:DegV family protein n=1 Tax=Candidatus Atopostipes pullistercoris TaxID=2838467 RepID=A0A9D2FZI3_9LACT|nr:DegV family protein [Candidatus Atopostipes pullistercoris]
MYQIVTDSCCDLPYTTLKEEEIDFVSMEIILNDDVFLDDAGETFDIEEFYNQLKNGALPSTSQVNVSKYVDFFTPYVKENIPVLYVCFSSGLSGSYQSALLAVEMIKEDYQDAEIHVFDTLAASCGQGLMVLDAVQNKRDGLSLEENISWLEQEKMNYQHWCTVDDLNHLYHGGRITKGAAAVGELLKVKPIIKINEEGKLVVHQKVRTRKKALRYIADKVIKCLETLEDPSEQTVIITNVADVKAAETVKSIILEKVQPKDILIYNLGPTISSHTGYGTVVAFVRGNEGTR